VVFHGPHGYISPNWYQTPNAVPTWNFATVHASGTPMKVDSDDEFAEILSRLVAENEAHYGGGERWRYEKLPAAYLKGMRQGIVAYRMPIAKFEAKFKLGQERSEADRAGVLAALGEQPAPRGLHAFTEQHYKRMKP
jgi:transcriptional regulator